MRGGFITDYLPKEGAHDWVCVEDFCGRCDRAPTMTDRGNWCAWWSPSRKVTKFGGDWLGTPDMPSSVKPTEDEVTFWAMNAPTHYARAWRATNWRHRQRDEWRAGLDRHYREHGYNFAHVAIRHPDGSVLEQASCVGTRATLKVLRDVRGSMERKGWGTSVITRLKVETGLTEAEADRRQKLAEKRKAA